MALYDSTLPRSRQRESSIIIALPPLQINRSFTTDGPILRSDGPRFRCMPRGKKRSDMKTLLGEETEEEEEEEEEEEPARHS